MRPYRAIFEKLPDGVTIHEPSDGAILDANERFCEMLGYERDELLDRSFAVVHPNEHPFTVDRARAHVRRTATEGPQRVEWALQTTNGEEIPVEVHLRRIEIEGEARVLAVVRDRRERERHRRELERERDRFEAVFESIPEPAIHGVVEDGHPVVKRVNRAFEDVFGHDREAAIGRAVDDLIVPPDGRLDADELNETFREDERIEAEVYRETPSGQKPFLLTAQSIRTQGSDRERLEGVAIYVDLSELKERERELEWKNERLDQFAHVVSHDIRNPLNVAQGRLELAAAECETDHLEPIGTALDRIEGLIEDLLTLARQGESVGDRRAVDLAEVVEAGWANVDTGEATLHVDATGTVHADPGRLQQLFENLIGNAIDHAGTGVTIRVGELPDGFYLEDDGPGIPEDRRQELFELGVTRADDGTGLGLAIVQEIADAHGWEVSIVDGEDGGARFEVTGMRGDE